MTPTNPPTAREKHNLFEYFRQELQLARQQAFSECLEMGRQMLMNKEEEKLAIKIGFTPNTQLEGMVHWLEEMIKKL